MYSLITILIVIACVLLILVVLIQNPKGGGLSQTFGGISNQFLGVKRTTDFLEKATWGFVIGISLLSLITFAFVGSGPVVNTGPKSELENATPAPPPIKNLPSAPATQSPLDSTRK
ncbi:MAG: preprotein translocase subunit SecG [Chitinophagales bacterium]|nr:preprotein translocase subunit SecG [Chitinophagales bacterium]